MRIFNNPPRFRRPAPPPEPLTNLCRIRYDVIFCRGPMELQNALRQINDEGLVVVSVTQDYSKYTIIFRRFD